MSIVIVDDAIVEALIQSQQSVELMSRDGRKLGIFIPTPGEINPAAESARMKALLEEIAATRYPLAPGTPDSTDMLREDRNR